MGMWYVVATVRLYENTSSHLPCDPMTTRLHWPWSGEAEGERDRATHAYRYRRSTPHSPSCMLADKNMKMKR
eukprot:scaffold19235_cov126-Isochrysis_galbana.AAC.19